MARGRKGLPTGTVRVWGGQKHVRHEDGWVLVGGKHHGVVIDKGGKMERTHDNRKVHTDLAHKHYEEGKDKTIGERNQGALPFGE